MMLNKKISSLPAYSLIHILVFSILLFTILPICKGQSGSGENDQNTILSIDSFANLFSKSNGKRVLLLGETHDFKHEDPLYHHLVTTLLVPEKFDVLLVEGGPLFNVLSKNLNYNYHHPGLTDFKGHQFAIDVSDNIKFDLRMLKKHLNGIRLNNPERFKQVNGIYNLILSTNGMRLYGKINRITSFLEEKKDVLIKELPEYYVCLWCICNTYTVFQSNHTMERLLFKKSTSDPYNDRREEALLLNFMCVMEMYDTVNAAGIFGGRHVHYYELNEEDQRRTFSFVSKINSLDSSIELTTARLLYLTDTALFKNHVIYNQPSFSKQCYNLQYPIRMPDFTEKIYIVDVRSDCIDYIIFTSYGLK